MKRYLVFAGSTYYPAGGWNDFCGSFDSELDALDYIARKDSDCEWWHIVDTTTEQVTRRKR